MCEMPPLPTVVLLGGGPDQGLLAPRAEVIRDLGVLSLALAVGVHLGPADGAIDGDVVGAGAHDGPVLAVQVGGVVREPPRDVRLPEERQVRQGQELGPGDLGERVEVQAVDGGAEGVEDELEWSC